MPERGKNEYLRRTQVFHGEIPARTWAWMGLDGPTSASNCEKHCYAGYPDARLLLILPRGVFSRILSFLLVTR